MKQATYKKAGVDIAKADSFKRGISGLLKRSYTTGVLSGLGSFGSLYSLKAAQFRDPVLVSSADGVGTKLKVAGLVNQHDSVGIDAVAMNVNDILCVGARPLFCLDYIAYSKLKEGILVDIVKGLQKGCLQAGCSLVGGETAQMPGMYKEGEYDLAGFCVGAVECKQIIDGSKIKPGDIVIGLESSGIHSNGYSLVRKVFSSGEQKRLSAELLKPTRIYVKPVLDLLKVRGSRLGVRGIAHITGGAFYDKIARILPKNVSARIYKDSWSVPKIFRLIQNKGGIEDKEMYHTFNMGIGMVLIVEARFVKEAISKLSGKGLKSWIIGEVARGKKEVEIL